MRVLPAARSVLFIFPEEQEEGRKTEAEASGEEKEEKDGVGRSFVCGPAGVFGQLGAEVSRCVWYATVSYIRRAERRCPCEPPCEARGGPRRTLYAHNPNESFTRSPSVSSQKEMLKFFVLPVSHFSHRLAIFAKLYLRNRPIVASAIRKSLVVRGVRRAR